MLKKSFHFFSSKLFARLYGWCGRRSEVTMVNSSWTEGHVSSIWLGKAESEEGLLHRVYPPCDTEEFERIDRGQVRRGGKYILEE